MIPSVLIPEVKEDERLQAGVTEIHAQWRQERQAMLDAMPWPENVRFVHDPEWQSAPQFFSIQAIRSEFNLTWKIVGFLFFISTIWFNIWTLF